MNIHEKLSAIQVALVSQKGRQNAHMRFAFRNCEDILAASKEHLQGAAITLSDDIVELGGLLHVRSTASLLFASEKIEVVAFAQISVGKKGLEPAQLTGMASSYARKYALSGLLAVDNNDDADTHRAQEVAPPAPPKENPLTARFFAAKKSALQNMDEEEFNQRISVIKNDEKDINKQIILIEKMASGDVK